MKHLVIASLFTLILMAGPAHAQDFSDDSFQTCAEGWSAVTTGIAWYATVYHQCSLEENAIDIANQWRQWGEDAWNAQPEEAKNNASAAAPLCAVWLRWFAGQQICVAPVKPLPPCVDLFGIPVDLGPCQHAEARPHRR